MALTGDATFKVKFRMTKGLSTSREDAAERRAPQSPADARRTADYLCDQMRNSAQALQLVIPPADICRRLRAALESATLADQAAMDLLRETVFEYTALLREKGNSIEAVLVSLKAVINIHVMPQTQVDPEMHLRYVLKDKISSWSIEEFFRAQNC